jgi:putative spermidine/putrescine transport system permease protein
MYLSLLARRVLAGLTAFVIVFLYAPIAYVVLLSFNKSRSIIFDGFTATWWTKTFENEEVRRALVGSVKTAIVATVLALILGTLASLAVHRFAFFGRDAVSFAVILPIALPGIVTGIALNAAFRQILGWQLGFLTLVVAHTTFCIVVVFNNVIARLRRLPGNLDEASSDLGADPFQTFRYVTFPLLRSALVAFTAGAGISTLPQFILGNYSRPNNLPIVNVVAVTVLALSLFPAWLAQRLTDV